MAEDFLIQREASAREEAIRTLSLRIPHIRGGAPSIAPNQLLQAPGAAGLAPGGANLGGLEQILRKIFGLPATGSFAPPSAPGMAPPALGGGGGGNVALPPAPGGGSAPAPHVTPINPGAPSSPVQGPIDFDPGAIAPWQGVPPGSFGPGGYTP